MQVLKWTTYYLVYLLDVEFYEKNILLNNNICFNLSVSKEILKMNLAWKKDNLFAIRV